MSPSRKPLLLVTKEPLSGTKDPCENLPESPSQEPEPGPAAGVPDPVELEPSEERADDEVALDLLLLVPPLDHAVLEQAAMEEEVGGSIT